MIPEREFTVIKEHLQQEINSLPKDIIVTCVVMNRPDESDNKEDDFDLAVINKGDYMEVRNLLALTLKEDKQMRKVLSDSVDALMEIFPSEGTEFKKDLADKGWCIHKISTEGLGDKIAERIAKAFGIPTDQIKQIRNEGTMDGVAPVNNKEELKDKFGEAFKGTHKMDMEDHFDQLIDSFKRAIEAYSETRENDGARNIILIANRQHPTEQHTFGSMNYLYGNAHGITHGLAATMLNDDARFVPLVFDSLLNFLRYKPEAIKGLEEQISNLKKEINY